MSLLNGSVYEMKFLSLALQTNISGIKLETSCLKAQFRLDWNFVLKDKENNLSPLHQLVQQNFSNAKVKRSVEKVN